MTGQRVGPPRSIDVAALAGVSRSTVSFILNGRGERFPEETRRRVLSAAAELNYQPSTAGRTLVTGHSDLVVLLLPNMTFGAQLQDAIDRLTEGVAALGMTVVVRFSSTRLLETVRVVTGLQARTVVDIGVLDAASTTALADAGVRVISEISSDFGATSNASVGRAQAVEVLRTGPRVVIYAMLADDRSTPLGASRADGVSLEARRSGAGNVVRVDVPLHRVRAGESLSRMLAVADGRPLGVCCYNDDVAIAIVGAALDRGLRIPQDVAIVGVDATAVGRLMTPPLTSIEVDFRLLTDHVITQLRSGSTTMHPHAPEGGFRVVRGGTS